MTSNSENTQAHLPPVRQRLQLLWRIIVMILLGYILLQTLLFARLEMKLSHNEIKVFPLDSYFYASYAVNILHGNGPQADWPAGPANKYFPGFSYWWCMFLSPNAEPLTAVRNYVNCQSAVIFFLIIILVLLGRLIWQDWISGLGYAALATSSPLLIRWSAVPMAEPLACLMSCGFACCAMLAWRANPVVGQRKAIHYFIAIAGMILFGAAGFLTRVEVLYVILASLFFMVLLRRLKWTIGAVIAGLSMLPVAIWQLWVTIHFAQRNSYAMEGIHNFSMERAANMFTFLAGYFVSIPNVRSYIFWIDFVMFFWTLFFYASLVVAARGYLSRPAFVSAWICIGYWVLHSLWYYQAERYNLIILPFGYLFLFDGLGRWYSWKNGWKARGASIFLLMICLLFVTYSRRHADSTIEAHIVALNKQVLPD